MEIVRTMKLHIHPDDTLRDAFVTLTETYRDACNEISEYVFNNNFPSNCMSIQNVLYQTIREKYGLKSQLAVSTFRTVTARYSAVKTQLAKNPYKFRDAEGKWHSVPRTVEWLEKPIKFSRPQADLVHCRDYSFVNDEQTNTKLLSLNTLNPKRVRVTYDTPENFSKFFDGSWKFGTGKLVELKGEWYLHIPMTKIIDNEMDLTDEVKPKHVVGVDRGLRFIATTFDEKGKTTFYSGKEIMERREKFLKTRSELQSRGSKSAKKRLKAIAGRENRWMSDVNHCLSKTLVEQYGPETLFVIEDLTGVSFEESNLSKRSKEGRNQVRSWAFYQLEQFLEYKAREMGSAVLRVPAEYTSQRCPKCGRINRDNRDKDKHEYHCDACGYTSNDDRVGAMNIYNLGTMFVSGDTHPRYGHRKNDGKDDDTLST